MGLKHSDDVWNAMLDAKETTIGTSPIMKIFDDGDLGGSVPANCAAADVGTVLATLTLPSDWMAAAASRAKAMSGTWEDTEADNDGTAEYYRIYDATGTTCHEQGLVSKSGDGGDLIVDNDNFAAGQPFSITSFTWNGGN